MPVSPVKREKPNENLSQYDELALQVAKSNPNLTNYEIGKKLCDLGVSKNHKSFYSRWSRNDYLRREIQEVRNHNVSEIQRKLVPKALKKLNKQLHNNDDKLQMQAIQTTLKHGMGEPIQPATINNIRIDSLQAVLNNVLGND